MSFSKVSGVDWTDHGLDMTTVPANLFEPYDRHDGLGVGIRVYLHTGALHWSHGCISMTLGA